MCSRARPIARSQRFFNSCKHTDEQRSPGLRALYKSVSVCRRRSVGRRTLPGKMGLGPTKCALRDIADLMMRKLHGKFGDVNSVLSIAPKELAVSLACKRRSSRIGKISALMTRPPEKPRLVLKDGRTQ